MAQTQRRGIAGGSVMRLAADVIALAVGAVSAIVTARVLGPEGKGVLAALTFLAGVVAQGSSLALGEAAVVFVGSSRAEFSEAVRASVALALALAAAGTLLFLAIGGLYFAGELTPLGPAMLLAAAAVPLGVTWNIVTHLLNARHRVVASSVAFIVTSCAAAAATVLLVAVLDGGVLGGLLAPVIASTIGLALVFAMLRRDVETFRPRWDRAYVGPAVRYGATLQAGYLATMLSNRIDLLFVYRLADEAAAGHYSVALTVGTLAVLPAFAVSYATFPRIAAGRSAEDAAGFARVGVAGCVLLAIPLAALTPLIVPTLFGEDFAPAVGPTMILVGAGVVWGAQWLLCRAQAALARPSLLLASFGASLLVMAILDVLLIPVLGLEGAALAALAGPVAGLLVAIAVSKARPLDLVPRPRDFARLGTELRSLLRRTS